MASRFPSGEKLGLLQSDGIPRNGVVCPLPIHPHDRCFESPLSGTDTQACRCPIPRTGTAPVPGLASTAFEHGHRLSGQFEPDRDRMERRTASRRSRRSGVRLADISRKYPPRCTIFRGPSGSDWTTMLPLSKLPALVAAVNRIARPPLRVCGQRCRSSPSASCRHGFRCAACRLRRGRCSSRGPVRHERDRPVFGPRAATAGWRIAQRDRSSAGDRNLFQLAVRKERNPLAVGREERIAHVRRPARTVACS